MDICIVLGLIGNLTAMVMFLSPTPTLWRIVASRDTGNFSPVPYACTLLNCLLWLLYGLPAVTSHNALLITVNGAGCALECAYLLVFFTFAPAANRGFLSMLVLGVIGCFVSAIAVAMSVFDFGERAKFVGALCVVVGTCMYASPLSVLRLVIATRSVDYMPLPISLCSLINALLWTSYGVLKHDRFLIIPNTLGSILAVLQLAVYAHYYHRPRDESLLPDGHNESSSRLRHSQSAIS